MKHLRRKSLPRRIALFLLVLMTALSAVGCGGSGPSDTLASGSGSSATPAPVQTGTEGALTVVTGEKTIEAGESPGSGGAAPPGLPAASAPAAFASADESDGAPAVSGKAQVTVSISAAVLLDRLEELDPAKRALVPADGMLVPAQAVSWKAGDTVFDALLAVTKDRELHMEYVSTPLYQSSYIEGIGNLYEMDAGPLSGWMYKVNGVFPGVGCSRYELEAGDVIEWVYTCDLGRDVGGDWDEQNSDR